MLFSVSQGCSHGQSHNQCQLGYQLEDSLCAPIMTSTHPSPLCTRPATSDLKSKILSTSNPDAHPFILFSDHPLKYCPLASPVSIKCFLLKLIS
jgi:hypothetical protein